MTCRYYLNPLTCNERSRHHGVSPEEEKKYCSSNYASCPTFIEHVRAEEERDEEFERRIEQEERRRIEIAAAKSGRRSMDNII